MWVLKQFEESYRVQTLHSERESFCNRTTEGRALGVRRGGVENGEGSSFLNRLSCTHTKSIMFFSEFWSNPRTARDAPTTGASNGARDFQM